MVKYLLANWRGGFNPKHRIRFRRSQSSGRRHFAVFQIKNLSEIAFEALERFAVDDKASEVFRAPVFSE